MRKFLTYLLLLSAIYLPAFSQDLLVSIGVDWGLSIRGGLEYRFHPNLGLKADLGASIMGVIVVDMLGVFYILPEDSSWRLNILAGIPNAVVPFSLNAAMVSFGASIVAGRRLTGTFSLDIRFGAGFPLFFERGKKMIRDIKFPFDLWPDAMIVLNFRPGG